MSEHRTKKSKKKGDQSDFGHRFLQADELPDLLTSSNPN